MITQQDEYIITQHYTFHEPTQSAEGDGLCMQIHPIGSQATQAFPYYQKV